MRFSTSTETLSVSSATSFTSPSVRSLFDGKIVPVPPLHPGAVVAHQVRVAQQAEDEVRVSRAVVSLAVGDDGLIRRRALRDVHRAELVQRLEGPVRPEVPTPFNVDGSRNMPAPLGEDVLALVLGRSACIHERYLGILQAIPDPLGARNALGMDRGLVGRRGGLRDLLAERKAGALSRLGPPLPEP